MSAGIGWQRAAAARAGRGRLAPVLRGALRRGYDGAVTVEHEDRQFEATDALVKDGFLIARNTLAPFIPSAR